MMKRSRRNHDDDDDYQTPSKKTTKKGRQRSPSLRVTRLMRLDAARRAVFETVELLENIFEQLPPLEIVVCERVCRQFQEVVKSSHKLQCRLFRKVAHSGETWTVRQEAALASDGLWSQNGEHRFELASPSAQTKHEDVPTYQACLLNTTFFAPFDFSLLLGSDGRAARVAATDGTTVLTNSTFGRILADLVKGRVGSWGNMHITSPPCRDVHIRLKLRLSSTQTCRIDKHVISPAGVTLSELARQLSFSTGGSEFGADNSRQLIRRSNGLFQGIEDCSGAQLSNFIASWESQHGTVVDMDQMAPTTWFKLRGVVLPTDEEMKDVRGRRNKAKA